MRAFYTLKNGDVFSLKLGNLLTYEYTHKANYPKKSITINYVDPETRNYKNDSLLLYCDKKGYYVIYHDEIVYIKNFDYVPLEELVEMIDSPNKYQVTIDMMIATLIKEKDRVLCIESMKIPTVIDDSYEPTEENTNEMSVLCRLFEKKINKGDWKYRIETRPVDDYEYHFYGSNNQFAAEFYNKVMSGEIILLVDTEKTKENSDSLIKIRKK